MVFFSFVESRFDERKRGWREAEVSRDREPDESVTVGPGPHTSGDAEWGDAGTGPHMPPSQLGVCSSHFSPPTGQPTVTADR